MKFVDFFSGIGGFRLGMEMAGHTCVGHCEIDKYADKSYRAMHDVKEWEWYANDIRNVEPGDMPDADCYCGGFPCQSFSVAGKRGGFEDTRGTLFFEVMRLAAVRKPKYLFLENVAGLLSHDGGKTFGTILNTLGQLGYWYEYQVLNSKDFGVPQNRERVFIIGHLGEYGGRKVFPIFGENAEATLKFVGGYKSGKLWVDDGKEFSRNFPQGNRVYDSSGLSSTLNSQGGGLGAKTGLYMIPATINKETDMNSIELKDIGKDTANCIVSREYKGIARSSNVIIQAVLTPDREEKRQNGRRIKDDGEEMFTLTAQDKHGVMISGIYTGVSPEFQRGPLPELSRSLKANTHDAGVMISEATKKGYAEANEGDSINLAVPGSETRRGRVGKGLANTLDTSCNQGTLQGTRIRKLIPKECFRLQGFMDEYFDRAADVNSDSQLYKQAGNSVTVNVIYAIAQRL